MLSGRKEKINLLLFAYDDHVSKVSRNQPDLTMKKVEHSERCLVIEIQTGNLYADFVCEKMTDQEHANSSKMTFHMYQTGKY